jgi:hypothetical protein
MLRAKLRMTSDRIIHGSILFLVMCKLNLVGDRSRHRGLDHHEMNYLKNLSLSSLMNRLLAFLKSIFTPTRRGFPLIPRKSDQVVTVEHVRQLQDSEDL